MTRFCNHEDARCLEHDVQCGDCDENGYPTNARRRLKRQPDGTVRDLDDQQVLNVKKTKTGDRLVPKIDGGVQWKGGKGFASMLLIISCLGAEGEYVLWDSERNKEMDVEEWKRRKYSNTSCPPRTPPAVQADGDHFKNQRSPTREPPRVHVQFRPR